MEGDPGVIRASQGGTELFLMGVHSVADTMFCQNVSGRPACVSRALLSTSPESTLNSHALMHEWAEHGVVETIPRISGKSIEDT